MNKKMGKICAGWRKAVSGLLLTALIVAVAGCDAKPGTDAKPSAKATRQAAVEGTIVALGDSLTAGLRVPEENAYPAVLARKLEADGYAYRVVNAGVSGETSSGALSRIDWVISSLDPDIVILETGANDGLRGIDPKLLEANLDKICARLKAKNIDVLLAGMKMLPNLGPEYTKAFAAVYPKMARKYDLVFMPFILKDVAGDPGLNQPDRLHPTARGYEKVVRNIYPYVLQAIERHRKRKP
jgi:acyl-CoA thioesterase-1